MILEWNNDEGIIFKKIELDDKYLFKITQEVQNNTNQTIDLYPYAQITEIKYLMIFKIFIFLMKDLLGFLMKN